MVCRKYEEKTGMINPLPTEEDVPNHDDVIKWKHFPRYWPFVREIHRSPVSSPHKGQWRWALIFLFILSGCANNREADDLRRHRVHYDVTVMCNHISHKLVCFPTLNIPVILIIWQVFLSSNVIVYHVSFLVNYLISPWTKWPPFHKICSRHFRDWRFFNFKLNFIEICSLGSNWQYVSIGLDNGLVPPRLAQFTDAYTALGAMA